MIVLVYPTSSAYPWLAASQLFGESGEGVVHSWPCSLAVCLAEPIGIQIHLEALTLAQDSFLFQVENYKEPSLNDSIPRTLAEQGVRLLLRNVKDLTPFSGQILLCGRWTPFLGFLVPKVSQAGQRLTWSSQVAHRG